MFARRLAMLRNYLQRSARSVYLSRRYATGCVVSYERYGGPPPHRVHAGDRGTTWCKLQGLDRPLYWPRSIAGSWLNQLVSEAFYVQNPRFYEVLETR